MRHRIALCVLCCCVQPAHAQSAVATSSVNVRSGQSTASRVLDQLIAGDTVQLVSPSLRLGYYHIQEADGTKGWVYRRFLKVLTEPTTTGVVPVTPTPSPGTPPRPPIPAGVAEAVDSSWEKAVPQTATFQRGGFASCGPGGPGGGSGNTPPTLQKNPRDEAIEYPPVPFDAVLALPYPKNHQPQRQSWS